MKTGILFLIGLITLNHVVPAAESSSPTATENSPKSLPPLPPVPRVRMPGDRPAAPAMRKTFSVPAPLTQAAQVPKGPGADFPPAPLLNPSAQFAGQPTPVPQPSGLPSTNRAATVQMPEGVLTWLTDLQEHHLKPGETNVHFVFVMTNTAPSNVVVTAVRTSCGCTIAKVPPMPWVLKPGERGEVAADVDVRRKVGTLNKTVTVETTLGYKTLMTRVHIPHQVNGDPASLPDPGSDRAAERARNIALSAADRQAVFKGECAVCHTEPTKGQMGEKLFAAACSICHEGPNRASMVPDLAAVKTPRDKSYWKQWITEGGKPGGLMPSFTLAQGGPLSDEQISSLVDFLVVKFPSTPAATGGGGTQ